MKKVPLTAEDAPGAVLMKYPSECPVLELRRWIECHEVKRTGKKQELIARVRECLAINKSVGPKIDSGKWYNLKRIQ